MSSESPKMRHHKSQHNPDIDHVSSITLYEGQRVRHDLVYGVVNDRNTGAFHHDYATFKTFRKTKTQPWKLDAAASFTLSEDKTQALSQALQFLDVCRGKQAPAADGEYLLLNAEHPDERLLLEGVRQLSASEQVDVLLRTLSPASASELPALMGALEQSDAAQLDQASRLLRIAAWRRALRTFRRLLKDPQTTAQQFALHLQSQPWMLGEVLPEDQRLLEVKTPLDHPLFSDDEAHASWTPCLELMQALGQVQMHLAGYDNPRQRACLVIGHTQGDPGQEQALQLFNSHLSRIEVLSFDQIDQQAYARLLRLQQAGRA
ncbi:MAG: hypothetical protein ACO1RX_19350 [Candidatus Sericytochromatia bacterium]